ncbi:hypothetical protein EIP86_009962 [Pleurotus ostreatoroseus]|nr:hypothetical protein EIP86_009962 [Pleurotus ostreatoroseus]
MSSNPRRRRYGFLSGKPKRPRLFKAASQSNTSPYDTVPVLTKNISGIATQGTGLHLAYMADIPKPWTDTIPEHWCDQMPEHWRTPQEPVQRIIFMLLCMGALGQFQMVQLWDACRDDETFRIRKESFMERITTITVVLGLLIATYKSFDNLAKIGGVFTVLIPASMAPVYAFSLRYSRRRKEPGEEAMLTSAKSSRDSGIEDDGKEAGTSVQV